MTNREKAQCIVTAMWGKAGGREYVSDIIEAELNRLDTPTKKWEPRGGFCVIKSLSSEDHRLSGREYPTEVEAARAAPLHRKLDRLVNWLIEHTPEHWKGVLNFDLSARGNLRITFWNTPGEEIIDAMNSGEVEL